MQNNYEHWSVIAEVIVKRGVLFTDIAAALESGCLEVVAGVGAQMVPSIASMSRRCTVWSVIDSVNQHNHLLTRCAHLYLLCVFVAYNSYLHCRRLEVVHNARCLTV